VPPAFDDIAILLRRIAQGSQSLTFGPTDLVYGPDAGGALERLTLRAGGRMLVDVGARPRLVRSFRDWTLIALDGAAGRKPSTLLGVQVAPVVAQMIPRGTIIRFDLTHMQDLAGALMGTGDFGDSVTALELRYIRDHWRDFKRITRFYCDDREVRPPWR
jgi:hypothetical protein